MANDTGWDDEPVGDEFYSLTDAALGLARALRDLEEVQSEIDSGDHRDWGGPPLHMEQRRERAVSRVRAAVRYLYSETD